MAKSIQEEGVVKWFDIVKGFGFIAREDKADIFVHYSEIVGTGRRFLNQGDFVKFDVVAGDRGLKAVRVEKQ